METSLLRSHHSRLIHGWQGWLVGWKGEMNWQWDGGERKVELRKQKHIKNSALASFLRRVCGVDSDKRLMHYIEASQHRLPSCIQTAPNPFSTCIR